MISFSSYRFYLFRAGVCQVYHSRDGGDAPTPTGPIHWPATTCKGHSPLRSARHRKDVDWQVHRIPIKVQVLQHQRFLVDLQMDRRGREIGQNPVRCRRPTSTIGGFHRWNRLYALQEVRKWTRELQEDEGVVEMLAPFTLHLNDNLFSFIDRIHDQHGRCHNQRGRSRSDHRCYESTPRTGWCGSQETGEEAVHSVTRWEGEGFTTPFISLVISNSWYKFYSRLVLTCCDDCWKRKRMNCPLSNWGIWRDPLKATPVQIWRLCAQKQPWDRFVATRWVIFRVFEGMKCVLWITKILNWHCEGSRRQSITQSWRRTSSGIRRLAADNVIRQVSGFPLVLQYFVFNYLLYIHNNLQDCENESLNDSGYKLCGYWRNIEFNDEDKDWFKIIKGSTDLRVIGWNLYV